MSAPPILLVLVLGLVGIAFSVRWAREGLERRRELQFARKLVVLFVALLSLAGALGIVVGLLKGFGAVGGEAVDPAQKARILAEGISESINYVVMGVLVWLPGTIALVVLLRKRRTSDEGTDGGLDS